MIALLFSAMISRFVLSSAVSRVLLRESAAGFKLISLSSFLKAGRAPPQEWGGARNGGAEVTGINGCIGRNSLGTGIFL